jgi:hypothetical protein
MEAKMIPIETATSREILALASSEHSMHSMDGAVVNPSSISMNCSCGSVVTLTADDAELTGQKLGAIVSRLRKLNQVGRTRS